jgi:hypothetical protein
MSDLDSKTEAEARRLCDRGLASYLSERHSTYIHKGLSYGVIGGALASLPVWILSVYGSTSKLWALAPFGLGVVSGVGYGLLTVEGDDPAHISDFEAVCSELEEEEEETPEEEGVEDEEEESWQNEY